LLRTHHPDLNLVAMPNVSSALQALATDEVDAVVGDLASSVWSLRQLKLDGLYVSGETPYRYQLAMAVPRNKMLVGILDKVLADMSPAKSARSSNTGWAMIIGPSGPTAGLRPAAVLLLMAVLAVVIRINRRLSSEISRNRNCAAANTTIAAWSRACRPSPGKPTPTTSPTAMCRPMPKTCSATR
jgi:hypothetical protein